MSHVDRSFLGETQAKETTRERPSLTVSSVLKQYTEPFIRKHHQTVSAQVASTLGRIGFCRTPAMGGRTYKCTSCDSKCYVYNSCTDRHCPQCVGARRADWLAKTKKLLRSEVTYFQVVFTLPEQLSALALNQRLDHHAHIHALVPGSGPSLDGRRWVPCRMTKGSISEPPKPFLVDNTRLGCQFRDAFIAGVERLTKAGKLQIVEALELKSTLEKLRACAWVVFIEGPPTYRSKAEHVLKYLARYITGGPIGTSRLIDNADGAVSFWARSRDKSKYGQRVLEKLPGIEFVRRWSLHILPKGFTRTRQFGCWSNTKRKAYEKLCELLSPNLKPEVDAEDVDPQQDHFESNEPEQKKCPRCDSALELIGSAPRPRWNELFYGEQQPRWWRIYAGSS